jgi:hypothetical protein
MSFLLLNNYCLSRHLLQIELVRTEEDEYPVRSKEILRNFELIKSKSPFLPYVIIYHPRLIRASLPSSCPSNKSALTSNWQDIWAWPEMRSEFRIRPINSASLGRTHEGWGSPEGKKSRVHWNKCSSHPSFFYSSSKLANCIAQHQ